MLKSILEFTELWRVLNFVNLEMERDESFEDELVDTFVARDGC